ncbi:hypothetical protein MettiDRAFT_0010 [Methanolobus tindarius DSM 2278]|uniref:Trypsin-like serine protease with C-terminal PDZ domain n=1 Tax=Methanolobus tindarius DSM 2278 TaxID=1090322 RepID=W9DNP6_METTI|nr:serine protease [Methanolobus tindarius]ETA66613.1 hypothetical protein MettiDRAFT_0010 [Methanolobus tindarius DSM 2278]
MDMKLTDLLVHSTVKIETICSDDSTYSGTGFFFQFSIDGQFVPVIITNKHVIEDSIKGYIHLTKKDRSGKPIISQHERIEIDNFERFWIPHPDQNIDLCMLFIRELRLPDEYFIPPVPDNLIPSSSEFDSLIAIEEITMIGYPIGLWDSVNNMPIVRRGITATHPRLNYEGKSEFLIDAACFPGSSGSPVFLLNIGSYSGESGIIIGTRIKLLGILYSGPQHGIIGEICELPMKKTKVSYSSIPTNLGAVIKSTKLLDFKPFINRLL